MLSIPKNYQPKDPFKQQTTPPSPPIWQSDARPCVEIYQSPCLLHKSRVKKKTTKQKTVVSSPCVQVVILDFPDVADSRALEKLYSVSSCRCFIQGFPRFCVGSYCYPRFPNDTPEFMKFINMGVFPKKVIITFFQWYPPTDILFDTKFWHYISQYAQCGIWRSIKSRIFHLGRVNVPAVPAISSVWTARCQGCWPTG